MISTHPLIPQKWAQSRLVLLPSTSPHVHCQSACLIPPQFPRGGQGRIRRAGLSTGWIIAHDRLMLHGFPWRQLLLKGLYVGAGFPSRKDDWCLCSGCFVRCFQAH